MSYQETFRKRMDGILDLINQRADAEVVNGEEMMEGQISFAAIGFATGVRFVRDIILVEFNELWPDDDDYHDVGKEQEVVFEDDGKFYYWDEVWQQSGPYNSKLEAYWELHRYAYRLRDNKNYPSYAEVAPILEQLVDASNE